MIQNNKLEKSIKVDIVIAAYNAEKSIERCIDSLLKQTYKNIKIIVIDDGSTDSTYKLCKNFVDERILILHTENKGVSHARNLGLSYCNDEYVTFCDADDFYTVDHINEVVKSAIIKNADIVISGYFLKHDVKEKKICKQHSGYINKKEIIEGLLINNDYGGFCWNKLFKINVIKECRFPEDLTHCEDTYFLFSTFANANQIYYLAEPLSYYFCNDKSATSNLDRVISKEHELQFSVTYKKILKDFSFCKEYTSIIYQLIFETSVIYGWKYKKARGKDKQFKKNLIRDEHKYLLYYLSSNLISSRRKLKRFVQVLIMSVI